MSRKYRIVVPLLGVWLAGWISLSWPAIQDDSLIHLRYADNLWLHHFITYDGVHANYGASSLLYVGILAVLRSLSTSPDLARATSSVVHVLLFAGMALAMGPGLPRSAKLARLAGLVLLSLMVMPSAVRWLDDGMETGIVVAVVSTLAWLVHGQASGKQGRYLPLLGLSFLAVLLRTELLLVCVCGFVILVASNFREGRAKSRERGQDWECSLGPIEGVPQGVKPASVAGFDARAKALAYLEARSFGAEDEMPVRGGFGAEDGVPAHVGFSGNFRRGEGVSVRRVWDTGWRRSHLLVGASAALGVILATMHVLLPDTALAKSHGIAHWFNPIHDTAITLGGAFSFGIGMLMFWLLTLALVTLRAGRLTLTNAVANCFCPVVLALSALRGQEIQGVRYFAWTFFFSIVWNVLELARPVDGSARVNGYGRAAIYIFLGLLAVDLPFESVAMHRVLTHRSATMRSFESQGLEALKTRHGIASDIGYIGYFTNAEICDVAGLVNGRAAAKLGSVERVHACLRTSPDFLFVNASQLVPLIRMADLSQWKVCGAYEFANVRSPDTHYLIVRPEVTAEACHATARLPASLESILPPTP